MKNLVAHRSKFLVNLKDNVYFFLKGNREICLIITVVNSKLVPPPLIMKLCNNNIVLYFTYAHTHYCIVTFKSVVAHSGTSAFLKLLQ